MIVVIRILTILLFIYGFHRILMGVFKLPSLKVYRTAHKMIKVNKGGGVYHLIFQNTVNFLCSKLKLNESKRNGLNIMLRYFDENISPELFVSRQIAMALFMIIPAIILYFIFPIFSLAVIFLAIFSYFKSGLDLEKRYNLKRTEIEYELPRFCATILQEIKSSRDILGILERYMLSSRRALKKELEITLADMKSSNYEAALVRLESRVSLGTLSDIVRGLIGVARGDDTISYFEMLSHDMDAMELQRLEAEAAKQPERIKKYQFLILVAMILMYFITIAVYLLTMEKPAYL